MPNSDSFQEFLGEEVVDAEGKPVGVFACYWEHEPQQPVLLGIHCDGDEKRTHVAPAQGSRLSLSQSYVIIAHPKQLIQKAPALNCECELSEEFERRVCAYYELPEDQLPTRHKDNVRVELKRIAREKAACANASPKPAPEPPGTV